jgi:FMN phosphatase YigB (HAD superfamily)
MLTTLLLDLGDTLVREGTVIAHVPGALDTLAAMHLGDGRKLELAVVSDYQMPQDGDPAEVAHLFDEYIEILRAFGLLIYFEPPSRRVTLSTQAGVRKPDAAIFRLALRRLGLEPDLRTAMFVTESAQHISAARMLGMTAWRFGGDFNDWADFPSFVANAVANSERPLAGNPQQQAFYDALEDTHAVSHTSELGAGQTHVVTEGLEGPVLLRKRFSID